MNQASETRGALGPEGRKIRLNGSSMWWWSCLTSRFRFLAAFDGRSLESGNFLLLGYLEVGRGVADRANGAPSSGEGRHLSQTRASQARPTEAIKVSKSWRRQEAWYLVPANDMYARREVKVEHKSGGSSQ